MQEVLIGAVLGLTARLTISALEVAGSVIAQQLGLGFVTAVDPTQGEQASSSVIPHHARHHAVLRHRHASSCIAALNDSYSLFEPGEVPATATLPRW